MISHLKLTRRMSTLIAAVVLAFAALLPLLQSQLVHADELQNRKVTIDKGYINASDVEFAFEFDFPGTAQEREGMILSFCTAALGPCVAPTGMDVGSDTISVDSQANWPANATAFAQHSTDQNACQAATNSTFELCFNRTAPTADTGQTDVEFVISGLTAPSTPTTVYVRIALFDSPDFSSPSDPDRGVVAAAFVNQLTVSATVSEYLSFCVGSLDSGANDDCSDITGTTINLGTIPPGAVCISRLDVGDTGTNPCENNDGRRGYAMVATNAANGVVVSYYAEQDQTNTNNFKDGSLKIQGADCVNTVSSTDQCIESVGPSAGEINAGTEGFGMTISEIDVSKGLLTSNVVRAANYNGNGSAGPSSGCVAPDDACWAWQEDGTPTPIASSPTVVDDEMLILRFAAAATLTTPTGIYSAVSTYIATPTY